MILAIIIGMGCGFIWWATVAAILADFQGMTSEQEDARLRHYQGDLSMALFMATIFPIGTLIAPFITGFFQHGFNWKLSPGYQLQRQLRQRARESNEAQRIAEMEFRPFWREKRLR